MVSTARSIIGDLIKQANESLTMTMQTVQRAKSLWWSPQGAEIKRGMQLIKDSPPPSQSDEQQPMPDGDEVLMYYWHKCDLGNAGAALSKENVGYMHGMTSAIQQLKWDLLNLDMYSTELSNLIVWNRDNKPLGM